MSRETILDRVRTALGRKPEQPPAAPPEARIRIPQVDTETRIARLLQNVAALAGKTCRAATPAEACGYVAAALAGRRAVASNAPFLRECGITGLPDVCSGISGRAELRELCATLDVGITSADYALADTGSLVLISGPEEARMISLLPPAHIAVVPASRILTGLDELFSLIPQPAARSSSMVIITGPSRTADIEQILVRGVHGPGEVHVVAVAGV